jgi:multiple sugar transport system substrate-binding protein
LNLKKLSKGMTGRALLAAAVLCLCGTSIIAQAADAKLPYKGVELHFGVMADQFADYTKVLAKDFSDKTGAKVTVDILGYTELYQKLTQDLSTHTAQYDLMTTDILWTGEFAKNSWTKDLTPWINRDKKEIDYNDIMPVTWTCGSTGSKQIAFPLAGYANSLIYRKDLFEDPNEKAAFKAKYGYELAPPKTMDQLRDAAEFFTRPDKKLYGLVANGARGSAIAQDWMEYMRGFGGQVIDKGGNVAIDSPEGLESLKFFVSIFDKYAPPGAIGYWWDDRETAYRTGQAAMEFSWSIARAGYEDASISQVVGKTGMVATPAVKGKKTGFGFGGYGIGINSDSSPAKQEAAWAFIKYITGKDAQKAWMLNNGAPIRRSTLKDPELNKKMPWLPEILQVFENGDGDYRPRVAQANEIQTILGLRINQAITHESTPEQALSDAAKEIKALF